MSALQPSQPDSPSLSNQTGFLTKIGGFAGSGSEISAYDATTQRLFVISGGTDLEILDLSNPTNPTLVDTLDISEYGAGANSVAIHNGIVAVAVEAEPVTEAGKVVFFRTDGTFLNAVEVGALPDMLTFTPDGSKVLVANEGEPSEDYTVDPEGSVSIINLSNGVENATVSTADFRAFNDRQTELQANGVRILGPNATVAQDVEPEYIAISADGSTAYVTLQENNAVAVVDIATSTVTAIQPLGYKDYTQGNNRLDASDADGEINIRNQPVFGMYQPDAIATFTAGGQTYYITANEGDARIRPTGDEEVPGQAEGDLFNEEVRFSDLPLDPTAFPNAAELQADENLGRLIVTSTMGDTDGDGDFDQVFTYGGRSFSIRDAAGNLVYDSGDDFEQITAATLPDNFNSDNDENTFDTRSDNKGPEPEGVVTARINDRTYAFVGLERVGGIMVYEVTNPDRPVFVQYINTRDFSGDAEEIQGDSGPEGLTFISAEDSPNGTPLLVVNYEVSNTTAIFEVNPPVRISDIQGAAHVSPLVGQDVTDVPGIVTAVDSNGFYLQDPNPDDNDATSEGIFVFTGNSPTVQVGDAVQVSGTVSEFQPGGESTRNLSITQISGDISVEVLSSGNPLPTATIIGAEGRTPPTEIINNDATAPTPEGLNNSPFDPDEDGIDFYESLEGMRVTVRDAVAVSPTNQFGEIFTLADNGENATGVSDRGTINISPNDFNPERVQVQFDDDLLPGFEQTVNVGARLGDVTGVVGYSFGNYEVNVTEPFTPSDSTLQPEVSALRGTDTQLTIASYNVLNLDPKIEDPALTEGGENDVDDDIGSGQFDAIAAHIVNNLNSPDIVALQEIQDNDGAEISAVTSASETLEQLIDRIEAISGIRYAYIDNPFIGNGTSGGQPGGNIRNAFLYNPDRVSFVEGSLRTVTDPADQQTNENNPFFGSRLPLAATFTFNGEDVTVVNNHFSSKGGSAPLFGQLQPADQLQENPAVNSDVDVRRAQARSVRSFVDGITAENPDANVVVAGDLNEFEFISPLTILERSLTNLTNTLPENERYSYIFQGNSQSLDHILVSNNLADRSEFDAVHVNAEFSNQASDHDPLLVRITLNGDSDDALLNNLTTRTATTQSSQVATIDRGAGTAMAEPVTGVTNAATFSAGINLLQPSDTPLTSGLTSPIAAGATNGS
jgi:predicted extracellular nuclease